MSPPTALPAEPGLTIVTHAGRACWCLAVQQGTALVAPHGGQVLSWVPRGGKDVLWLSPNALPPPAATRGGVPICWPWFGKQGMPVCAMQHGPLRNRLWRRVGNPLVTSSRIQLELQPEPGQGADDPLHRFAPDLDVSLHITLDDTLTLELRTHNRRTTPFTLTQALHTYLAVDDVHAITIPALAGLPYHDKLTERTDLTHPQPWRYEGPCDRIYHALQDQTAHALYTLDDTVTQRQIQVKTGGSASVVLWNPGPQGARALADMPDDAWRGFVCLETSNAGADAVHLLPGEQHRLLQRLAVLRWT